MKDDTRQNIDFSEVDKYLTSKDGDNLEHYLPFISLLTEKYLTFQDFEKYTYDELLKIRRIYELSVYIKNKIKQNEENNN